MLTRLLLWFRGWRRDLDHWLVRAKREGDEQVVAYLERTQSDSNDNRAFCEEACTAAGTEATAAFIDRNRKACSEN